MTFASVSLALSIAALCCALVNVLLIVRWRRRVQRPAVGASYWRGSRSDRPLGPPRSNVRVIARDRPAS